MKMMQMTAQVSVSDQIDVADLQTLIDEGVELLVCNRPDGEDNEQTPYTVIQQEAEKLGLETGSIAFSSYRIQEKNRDAFIKLIRTRKRIHLYCRSGSRSERLWREANAIVGGEVQYIKAHENA